MITYETNSGLMDDSWDSVNYLFGGSTPYQTYQTQPSGFFPSPQVYTPIRSEIAQPAVSLGVPRPLASDAPSLAQTAAWYYNNWFDSPYEAELARPAVVVPTRATPAPPPAAARPAEAGLFGTVAKPWTDALGGLLGIGGQVLQQANEQLPNLLLDKWGLGRNSQVVNTRGDIETNVQTKPPMGLATVPGLKQGQPQSLFNIGYGPQQPVQTVPIADAGQSAIAISPVLVLLGLFLLGR